jgi:hypothetical protein
MLQTAVWRLFTTHFSAKKSDKSIIALPSSYPPPPQADVAKIYGQTGCFSGIQKATVLKSKQFLNRKTERQGVSRHPAGTGRSFYSSKFPKGAML